MNYAYRKISIFMLCLAAMLLMIVAVSAYECNDSIDNDGDGKIDLADPGCTSHLDNSEINPKCNDGIDNDLDGKIDMADSGCDNLQDNDENVVLGYAHGCFKAGEQLSNKQGDVTYTCTSTTCPDVCVLMTEFGNYSTVPYKCYGLPKCAYQTNGTSANSTPLTMGVLPLQLDHGVFSGQSVVLEIKLNKMAQLNLIDNSKGTQTNLCALCNVFKKSKVFSYGLNDFTIVATANPQQITKNIVFIVDNKKPLIVKQLPLQNKYVNESTKFIVAYTEDYLTEVTLTYGNSTLGYNNKTVTGCINGTKVNCSTTLTRSELAPFENGTMQYWFNLKDIAGSVKSGSSLKEYVDIKAPVINWINVTPTAKYPRMLNFNMTITEKFLDKVTYKDFNNRSTTLCSSLKNGNCQKTVTFKPGPHNITVTVSDKIGNNVSRKFNMTII